MPAVTVIVILYCYFTDISGGNWFSARIDVMPQNSQICRSNFVIIFIRPPVRSNGRTYKMLVMFFFFFNA